LSNWPSFPSIRAGHIATFSASQKYLKENGPDVRMEDRMVARQSIATRLTLLSRLKDWENQDSWREFFEIYWGLIYGLALKSGLTETEGQEVVQEVIIEVASKIKKFKYDPDTGSFKAWLRQLSRWRIRDQFRKRQKHLSLDVDADANDDEVQAIPELPAADFCWEDEWKRNLAAAAVDKLRKTLPAKHFQAFDLHVLRGWSAQDAAQVVGLRAAHVYLIKFRVASMLKKEISRLEREFV
jgi:RNA polymerase sigma factor (sigma-70 family)